MKRTRIWIAGGLVLGISALAQAWWVDEYKSGIVWPTPPVVTPGEAGKAPSDAIVLFDGTNLDAFEGGDKWVIENGEATVAKGGITTKEKFGSCQLHVEFASPAEVKGKGQGRGNSGIYLMGRYEVQVLDSFENETYVDGQCASIYKQQPPMVNACRKPGEWQTLDIIFTAPAFHDDGTVKSPAFVTVLHNGIVVHNHFELLGGTSYVEAPRYTKHPEREPISLQFHGNPVKYRNIWLRENITPLVGTPPMTKSEEPKSEEKSEKQDEAKPEEVKPEEAKKE